MGGAEVEAFEGVGRGVMSLLRLWKCVEKCGASSRISSIMRLRGGGSILLAGSLRAIAIGQRSMGPMRRRDAANWSAL